MSRRARRAALSTRVALAVLAIITSAVVVIPGVWHEDPLRTDLLRRFEPPSPAHPLGTDQFGRDLLARILHGGRVTLASAATVLVLSGGIGLALSLAGGLAGGWGDRVTGRVIDLCLALPSLVIALGIVGVIGRSLAHLTLALVIVSWPYHARLSRALVLREKAEGYVIAAVANGCTAWRVAVKHVLPNVAGPALVVMATSFTGAMLGLASLSFLGLGAQPPAPEWGNMIDEARGQFQTHPWPMTVPGAAITLTVLTVNVLGDALRDLLDPRLPT
jgi:peptide/nickel transport system permease protein